MVGETGFAPAWALAREFLRLECIHSTTRRKIGAAGAWSEAERRTSRCGARPRAKRVNCTPTRPKAQRFLRPPGLLFHAQPHDWSRRPESSPLKDAVFEMRDRTLFSNTLRNSRPLIDFQMHNTTAVSTVYTATRSSISRHYDPRSAFSNWLLSRRNICRGQVRSELRRRNTRRMRSYFVCLRQAYGETPRHSFRVAKATAGATSAKTGLPAVAVPAGEHRARYAWRRLEHPQGRAPCCLSYQDSPSLSTGWMQSGRSGRTRTFVALEGVAFTARLHC